MDGDPPRGVDSELAILDQAKRVIRWQDAAASLAELRQLVPVTVPVSSPCPGLRVRHMRKEGLDWWILFNETATPINTELALNADALLDPNTGEAEKFEGVLHLESHALRVLIKQS